MGHDHHHVLAEGERPFPLFPLLGAGGLVIISLLSVAWLQWFAKPDPAPLNAPPALAERMLSFEDTAAGQVVVRDADTGEVIARFEPGEQGFVRSTLRGLARARRMRGAGPTVPFQLEQRASGQLLLIDPVTEQTIDLWAFGQSNAQVFVDLLGASPINASAAAGGANDTDATLNVARSDDP